MVSPPKRRGCGSMKSNSTHEVTHFVIAVVPVWIGALAVWTASLLMVRLYVGFGADVPPSTLTTLQLSQNYVPFVFAAACTGLLGYFLARSRKYILSASIVILSISVICLGFALFSLAAPFASCGNYWPDWPTRTADTIGSPQAAIIGPGSPSGCRSI